jgi:phage gp46-like protein
MEEEVTDEMTGEKSIQIVNIPQVTLQQLQASVKVDITPKSVYDRFAQEQTIENMLLQGLLTPQRVGELDVYANLLDDDSVAPKTKILEAVERIREEQKKIAQIQAQAQAMQQRASQFLLEDADAQTSRIMDAQMQMQGAQMPVEATETAGVV